MVLVSKSASKDSEDLDNLQCLLAEVETWLSSQISEMVSHSIAPVKSLVASLQTVLNNRAESLVTEVHQLVDNIHLIVKQQVDEVIKQAMAAVQDCNSQAAAQITTSPQNLQFS